MTIIVTTEEQDIHFESANDWIINDGRLWVGKDDVGVAEFNAGQWLHVIEDVTPAEEEDGLPDSVDKLTLELLEKSDWTDIDADRLTLLDSGEVKRTSPNGFSYQTNSAGWIDVSLSSYGPYKRVSV